MARKTNISWTETTWNPVTGCTKVSEGCKYCYAEAVASRFEGKAFPNGFEITLKPHKLREPFTWKNPTLCFVNSMSDLFHEDIPRDYLDKIIDVIEQTPQHTYQVLTKREDALLAYSKERKLPENMWCGVTIENERMLKRLPVLKDVQCITKFISFEPLLGDLGDNYDLSGIDWVITGGESGKHLFQYPNRGLAELKNYKWEPKPEAIKWVNSILKKARESGTAFYHKQWGGPYPTSAGNELNGRIYKEKPA